MLNNACGFFVFELFLVAGVGFCEVVMDKKFPKVAVYIGGSLYATYFLADKDQLEDFISNKLSLIKEKYGDCYIRFVSDLDEFFVGESVHVWGDGDEVYVIERFLTVHGSDDCYGLAVLDSGCCESISKLIKIVDC